MRTTGSTVALNKTRRQATAAVLSNESGARSRGLPHLYQVVSGVAGAERPFKEHVESVGFLLGFNQLVVLL